MRAFVLLCTTVAAIATAATSASAESCQLKLIASLTLTESGDRLFAPVTVADRKSRLTIQLADAYSGITANVSKELSLRESPTSSRMTSTVNGQSITTLVTVPMLQLDRLVARDVKVFKIPSLSDSDGILGLDLLSTGDLELDLAHDKLNLFSRDHCRGKVIYWSPPGGTVAVIPLTTQKTGNVLTNMSVDGKTMNVGLTTTGRSTMGMNDAHRLFGIDEHSSGIKRVGTDSEGLPTYRYPFHEIDVQGLKIGNPDIILEGRIADPGCDPYTHFDTQSRDYMNCYGDADLFLGPSILRRLHLFFAFSEKTLYATAASD